MRAALPASDPPSPDGRDALCIAMIRRSLRTDWVGGRVALYRDVESTSDVLRRLAEAGAPEGTVVLAENQGQGRRRLGQPGLSPVGVGLDASVLFRPALAPAAIPVFAWVAALAVSDAARAWGVEATVRWPNDVVVDGRTVARTLVATATTGERVDYVILGVAVDLHVERAWLAAGRGKAARRRASAGWPIDRNTFTATFLNHLERWVDIYRTSGQTAVLGAWRQREADVGRRLRVSVAGETLRGRVLGVNARGELVLETAPGIVRAVAGGQRSWGSSP